MKRPALAVFVLSTLVLLVSIQADDKLTVALPDKAPDPIASVICL